MSTTLIATLGGLWAMLAWGASDWLAARSSKQISPYAVNLAIQLPGIIIWPLMLLISSQPIPDLHNTLILFAAGFCFSIAYISFVKALSKGHVGVVVPVSSTYPIITILLSVIFLSSIFTHQQYLAMFVIVAGVCLLGYERNTEKIPLRVLHRETTLALVAGLFWGLGNFFQNIVIGREQWISVVFIINIAMYIAVIILTLIFSRYDIKNFRRSVSNKYALWAGVLLSIGSLGFYYASGRAASVIIPSVIASASPLVASSMSAVFDKEMLGVVKRAGAVGVVVGIILLNLN